MQQELDTSWLSRKYDHGNEINTTFSTVAIGDFFAEGHEADRIIKEIHKIWIDGELTQQEALDYWADLNHIECW